MPWIAPTEPDTASVTPRCPTPPSRGFVIRRIPVTPARPKRPTAIPRPLLVLLQLLCLAAVAAAADNAPARRTWTVDGLTREALVYVPAQATNQPAPVVFAFHGHGGSMHHAARTFSYHTRWPEAIVVYLQGLNTPGRLTDPEGKKTGWQHAAGDQGDRDLKFFDAVLARLQTDCRVDTKRIYATGHSNGGAFTYLLWAERGDVFAAFAPSAAAAARTLAQLKPKPVLHVAGRKDALVKFEWQEQTMTALRRRHQCGEGRPWEGRPDCTLYPSALNAPVVTYIHPGPHTFPAAAPALIVQFFQQHALPAPPTP